MEKYSGSEHEGVKCQKDQEFLTATSFYSNDEQLLHDMSPVSLAMHINPSTKATIIIFRLFFSLAARVFVPLCCTAESSKAEKPKAEEKLSDDAWGNIYAHKVLRINKCLLKEQ